MIIDNNVISSVRDFFLSIQSISLFHQSIHRITSHLINAILSAINLYEDQSKDRKEKFFRSYWSFVDSSPLFLANSFSMLFIFFFLFLYRLCTRISLTAYVSFSDRGRNARNVEVHEKHSPFLSFSWGLCDDSEMVIR